MLDKVETDLLGDRLLDSFRSVRCLTEELCKPLAIEDFNLQAIAETSPVKWHLAHTTWFFETFILKPYENNYKPFHPQYEYLFNSYYNAVGQQFSRPNRHLLSRPTVDEVFNYRAIIDEKIQAMLIGRNIPVNILKLIRLGIHHEQQHQELLLTDLKYNLYQNPLFPAYKSAQSVEATIDTSMSWVEYKGGLGDIGKCVSDQEIGTFCFDAFCFDTFHFDNELPKHQHYLNPFALSNRLVTNGDFIQFIEAGGYDDPSYWLSDGWTAKTENGWGSPLYWFKKGNDWYHYTLSGVLPIDLNQAVTHVSYYEADAYASWAKARLPTEQEWESVARREKVQGNFLDNGLQSGQLMTSSAKGISSMQQLFGDAWEWTSSAYSPYPGYSAPEGAVGEYNGKFMANQFVLRGGSCVTSKNHIRATYRNFFYPDARWQFSGFRLARSL